MKRALILSASFVLAAWAAPAAAQNLVLTGKYGVTSTVTCNLLSGAVAVISAKGIYTFDGDGTGSVTETSSSNIAGSIGSTNINNHTYTFKYTASHDRSFTLTADPGSFAGTFVSGPLTGQTFSIDQLPPLTGFIGIYAATLTGATLETPIETVTRSDGNVSQRKCLRSRVFIKLVEE